VVLVVIVAKQYLELHQEEFRQVDKFLKATQASSVFCQTP
jgi:hypothetical protein